MGELVGYDDWLQAQNCLLGAALIDATQLSSMRIIPYLFILPAS